jgi:hypothetical protein
LNAVLARLKNEELTLEAPVNWDQAGIDNAALDKAVKERHELVTTDWKAKYDESVAKYDELLVENNLLKAGFLSMILGRYLNGITMLGRLQTENTGESCDGL